MEKSLERIGHVSQELKSVHITNYYHKDSGGISTAYNKLLEAANRRRRHVRLIVPGETSSTEDVSDFGKIYFVKASTSPLFDKRYRLMMPLASYIRDGSPIKQILREERPDIIEIGEKYTLSLMAGLLRRGIMNVSSPRPMLVHLSCERMDDNVRAFISGNWAARRFCESYVRNYIFPMFDFHLANSEYTASEIEDAVTSEKGLGRKGRFFGLCSSIFRASSVPPAERVLVNQCGVDNVKFSVARRSANARAQLIDETGFPSASKIVLYAGRLSPEKNVSILPKLLAMLASDPHPDFRMLIAGSGPSESELAGEFDKLAPGCARMLGHIGDAGHLADIFANCDAFVHPNPHEPFGITPLEAMASGLPVAATNSGGVLSYANDKNAWLTEPTPEHFADAIRSIFNNDQESLMKTQNALETSARYTWEASTDRLFELYDTMFEHFSTNRAAFEGGKQKRNGI